MGRKLTWRSSMRLVALAATTTAVLLGERTGGEATSSSSSSTSSWGSHPPLPYDDHPYYSGAPNDETIGGFDEWRFRSQVDRAMEAVKMVLDATRSPRLISEEEPYVYNDKFLAVEFVTNVAIATYVQALERLGLTRPVLDQLWEATIQNRSVPIVTFQARTRCTYVGQEDVKVVVAEREIERTTGTGSSSFLSNAASSETTKVKKTVTQYIWDVQLSYNVTLRYRSRTSEDADESNENRIVLRSGTKSQTIITRAKRSPVAYALDRTLDLRLTWLVQNLSPPKPTSADDGSLSDNATARMSTFTVDRLDPNCKTPRRNDNVREALDFVRDLYAWAHRVKTYLLQVDNLQRQETNEEPGTHHSPLNDEPFDSAPSTSRLSVLLESSELFIPIIPLIENRTVMFNDADALLAEHVRSMDALLESVDREYGANQDASRVQTNETLIESEEAAVTVLCQHLLDLSQAHADAVDYIEFLLKRQLQKAIGRNIRPRDVEEFLSKHSFSFFNREVTSVEPFARSIRQPDHYPDGVLSLENSIDAHSNVRTLVRKVPADAKFPVRLPIDAATTLELAGDRFLHGWMLHWFAEEDRSVRLVARARQFSSFLLLLGSMSGPDEFLPKHAIILRNKDEILIPLLTDVLPSAKSFRDAMETLSPEQQAFAKAFRAMQLQTSVFGVCVIQLKPQLELLLNLPAGALTKEIELTEDLMSLFVDYQIPSDLLSFDLDGEVAVSSKIQAVKGHVANVKKAIQSMKEQQHREERLKTEIRAEKAFSKVFEDFAASTGGSGQESRQFRRALHTSTSAGVDGYVPREFSTSALGPSDQEGADGPEVTSRREVPPIGEARDTGGRLDFTMIPKVLDAKLEKYDKDGSLRSVILRPTNRWTMRSQETLLSPVVSTDFGPDAIDAAKKKAFDLLDAISRSGTLPIRSSELHVFVAVSHCFEKSLVETVIEDNINPLEKLESSMLLLATTMYDLAPDVLVSPHEMERMKTAHPDLLLSNSRTIENQSSS